MIAKDPYLSIISPVYEAESIVDELVKRIKEVTNKITENFEIILVEDGSQDQSWEKIKENCKADKRLKGIKFSRNFGQHNAITAGLKESKGKYAIVMDCDLQDNPKYIPDMIKKAEDGFDIVYSIKKGRKHGIIKNFIALLFHKVHNWLIDNKSMSSSELVGAFSLINRKVIDAFCECNEYHRTYINVINWTGFSSTTIFIKHDERYAGESSYNFSKSIKLALDSIVSYSNRLLILTTYIGFIFSILGFISILYIISLSIRIGLQPGWASITVLIVFCTGLILISLGILGIYIGKIFEQAKHRPLYLVEEILNVDAIANENFEKQHIMN